jgi:LmbE family N-acetylglucosaminyl deacetylase
MLQHSKPLDPAPGAVRVVTPAGHPVETWRSALVAAPAVDLGQLAGESRRLVAVGAHPDDVTIGAGRLIARWVRTIGPVRAITFTAGENCLTHLGAQVPGLAARRLREWRCALAALGATALGCSGAADGAVTTAGTGLVAALLQHLRPGDVLLAPWRHDPHPDHAAAGDIARAAAARTDATLLEYPIWMTSWCDPDVLERTAYRLTRVRTGAADDQARRTALAHYASQRLPLLPDLEPVVPDEMLRHHHCQLVLRPGEPGDG